MNSELSNKNEAEESNRINVNYLTLRKYLGGLGVALPIALIIGNGFKLEESISHYYYTGMSVVFTGVLIAFGLFLISYKGYPKENDEIVSDNAITNIAGFLAITVALVPTACSYCDAGVPNGHDDTIRSVVHLISAGLFIALMGFMSFNQFVKGENETITAKRRKRVYRTCGIVIWVVVVFLLLEFILGFKLTAFDTFVGEAIALLFFGVAWLTKSESLGKIGL
ncbi:MAG: hypothetical protein OTI34_11375 [Lewinella sp.]|nr:hypothetical protein [Lewinella sp.]